MTGAEEANLGNHLRTIQRQLDQVVDELKKIAALLAAKESK